ncbi:MAG: hypothetical protein PHD19_09465 [Dechloromonas sp.]|nr:hypothetical protein [Dechloromonas sp.]
MPSVDLSVWRRIRERFEAGDSAITPAVREMAESVLGERFVRPAKPGSRPDRGDRAAADDSWNDDQWVPM